jgi:hypothetical protein
MGWQGTKLAAFSPRARREASMTSHLVEPTSMNSTPGFTRWRMAFSVASVADTGTAISTMSDPDTASSADSAATSMTPSFLACLVVDGDLL